MEIFCRLRYNVLTRSDNQEVIKVSFGSKYLEKLKNYCTSLHNIRSSSLDEKSRLLILSTIEEIYNNNINNAISSLESNLNGNIPKERLTEGLLLLSECYAIKVAIEGNEDKSIKMKALRASKLAYDYALELEDANSSPELHDEMYERIERPSDLHFIADTFVAKRYIDINKKDEANKFITRAFGRIIDNTPIPSTVLEAALTNSSNSINNNQHNSNVDLKSLSLDELNQMIEYASRQANIENDAYVILKEHYNVQSQTRLIKPYRPSFMELQQSKEIYLEQQEKDKEKLMKDRKKNVPSVVQFLSVKGPNKKRMNIISDMFQSVQKSMELKKMRIATSGFDRKRVKESMAIRIQRAIRNMLRKVRKNQINIVIRRMKEVDQLERTIEIKEQRLQQLIQTSR